MHAAGQEDLSDGQAIIAMDSCAQMMAARYDDKLGGFGSAPKFPRPAEMNLLLVQHLRAKAAGSKLEAGQPTALCLHARELQATNHLHQLSGIMGFCLHAHELQATNHLHQTIRHRGLLPTCP